MQLGWDQGDTAIDNFAISMEKRFGGGKDISMIVSMYGDGRTFNRTVDYTDTFTLDLLVQDKAGAPVDGAWVLIVSEGYYKDQQGNYPLYPIYLGLTGVDGHLKLKLGDNQNFYIMLKSPLGNVPEQEHSVAQVVEAKDAVKDAVITKTIALPGHMDLPVPEQKLGEGGSFGVEIKAGAAYYWNQSPFTGTSFMQPVDGSSVDLAALVLDQQGLDAFTQGKKPTVLASARLEDSSKALEFAQDKTLYLVLYPLARVGTGVTVDLKLVSTAAADGVDVAEGVQDYDDVVNDQGAEPGDAEVQAQSGGTEAEQESGGGGCTTHGKGTAGGGLIVLFLVVLLGYKRVTGMSNLCSPKDRASS
jgi:hypothetical protein